MSTENTVVEAYEKIKLFFHLKFNSPEVFRNRDPYSNEIEKTFENVNFLYLPVTPDGYSVVYSSLKNYSISAFVLDSISKAFFMTAGKVILLFVFDLRTTAMSKSWLEFLHEPEATLDVNQLCDSQTILLFSISLGVFRSVFFKSR